MIAEVASVHLDFCCLSPQPQSGSFHSPLFLLLFDTQVLISPLNKTVLQKSCLHVVGADSH